MKKSAHKLLNKITHGLKGKHLTSAIFRAIGRNGLFFGVAGIILSFIIFVTETYDLTDITRPGLGHEGLAIDGVLSVLIQILAVVLVVGLLVYAAILINSGVRRAVDLLAKLAKTEVNLKLELSLTVMIYSLAILLMVASANVGQLGIGLFFAFAGAFTALAFVVAQYVSPAHKSKRTLKSEERHAEALREAEEHAKLKD